MMEQQIPLAVSGIEQLILVGKDTSHLTRMPGWDINCTKHQNYTVH